MDIQGFGARFPWFQLLHDADASFKLVRSVTNTIRAPAAIAISGTAQVDGQQKVHPDQQHIIPVMRQPSQS
jgi:hypothetical protein